MTDFTNEELRDLIERKRARLEERRREMRDVQGHARLQADQHMNKLSDELDELQRHPRTSVGKTHSGSLGLLSAIKRTWRDITGAPRRHLN